MPKRGKCASNLKVIKSLPYDLAAIWRVGSASEMIRMGYNAMFGKMFFVALFCQIGPKMAFFAYVLLDKLITCVEFVLAIRVWGLEL